MSDDSNQVRAYYDAVASIYSKHYEGVDLSDISTEYPANWFRLQLLMGAINERDVRTIIDIGIGEGTPAVTFARAGYEVCGFDISENMVKEAKRTFERNGLSPDRVIPGDIEDPSTYGDLMSMGPFDAAIAVGVMPHVRDELSVLQNINALLREGGWAYLEFRNKLFALFTFNRYTLEFILEDLLFDVDEEIRRVVRADLEKRLRVDQPAVGQSVRGSALPSYDAIPSKFHNVFELIPMLREGGFSVERTLWYHYHPAMPYLEQGMERKFRDSALRLEKQPGDWRGMFLCSAFVVEARKVGSGEKR